MHLSVSVGRSSHFCMTPDTCYANCSTQRQPRERGERRWMRSNLFPGTFFPHQPVRTVTSCRNLTLHLSWKAELGIIFERIQAMTQGKLSDLFYFSAQFEHFKIFWIPLNNMFKNVPSCRSSWLMRGWCTQEEEGKWLFIKITWRVWHFGGRIQHPDGKMQTTKAPLWKLCLHETSTTDLPV